MPKEVPPQFRKRLYLVVGVISLLYVLIVVLLGLAWYAQQSSFSFHFFNDLAEWKQMDKWGHFFTAFQVSVFASQLLLWTHYFEEKKSRRIAAWVAFLIVSSIEIPDGFSSEYGASVFDIGANALGCLAFVLQNSLWNSIKVFPKFSAHLTGFAPLRPSLLGDGFFQRLLKDYNGQTYWFSVQLDFLKLPSWLCIAVGVGAEGMAYARDEQNAVLNLSPYRKYFISLDINLNAIKTRPGFWKTTLSILNMVKVPAPTLELSSHGVKFHAIYF
jgi:hypothetical protein